MKQLVCGETRCTWKKKSSNPFFHYKVKLLLMEKINILLIKLLQTLLFPTNPKYAASIQPTFPLLTLVQRFLIIRLSFPIRFYTKKDLIKIKLQKKTSKIIWLLIELLDEFYWQNTTCVKMEIIKNRHWILKNGLTTPIWWTSYLYPLILSEQREAFTNG